VPVAAFDAHPPPEVVAAEQKRQRALEHGAAEVERDRAALAAHERAVQELRLALHGLARLARALQRYGTWRPLVVEDPQVAQVAARALVDVAVERHHRLARPGDLHPALERAAMEVWGGDAQQQRQDKDPLTTPPPAAATARGTSG
jgi:hypothetical protein